MARVARTTSLVMGTTTSSAELVDGIIARIADGALSDGDRLPSTRALAAQTGLSRGTVVRAYDELAAAGFIESAHGSGTSVTPGAAQAARAGARTRGAAGTSSSSPPPEPGQAASPQRSTGPSPEPPPDPSTLRASPRSPRDLRPGVPDATLVDERAWRSAMRAAAAHGPTGLNPWEEPSPALRAALADHLRRHRGIAVADPQLFDSSRSAIAALCAAFVRGLGSVPPGDLPPGDVQPGDVPFHMEDPGYRGALLMAREQGLRPVFHPVDPTRPDGLDAARLGDAPAIVYVTPAHQYPLGHRMSVDRRVALVEWARRTGSLIIEDDYDGEFRYGVAPLPALVSLPGAREHVAYVGTSSKSVAPDLRVAWCLPPESLAREVHRWLAVHRRGPSSLPAEALAAFLASGAMDRHLARAARVYGDRRRALVSALRASCPGLEVTGVEAGLHLCVLTPECDDDELVRSLSAAGWEVRALSSQSEEHPLSGLIVNYARLSKRDAGEFAEELGNVLASAPGPRS